MGLLDSLEGMAASKMGQGGGSNSNMAGGLMSVLEEHPGGLGGLMSHMQNNGVDPQSMTSGQPSSPQQMEQGLGGSGIIEKVAERTGMSPQMITMGMATMLPMIMSHMTQGGTTAPPSSGLGGMAGELMGKFL